MENSSQESIRTKVVARYSQVAISAENRFKYPVGSESVNALNYPAEIVQELPAETTQHFCGVGNPFSLGTLHLGESVLDVGCGAGSIALLLRGSWDPTEEL